MIVAWNAKGSSRDQLLKRWMQNPDVGAVTMEILHSEKFQETGT